MTWSALILILIMNRPTAVLPQEPLLYICISFEGLSLTCILNIWDYVLLVPALPDGASWSRRG